MTFRLDTSAPTAIAWDSLRSPQFDRALLAQTVAILPIGSTEQHGPHLPVQVDTLLAVEIAPRAARQCASGTRALVLPPLWVSLAEHHMEMAGTLTLDHATMLAFIRAVVRSLQRQGVQRVLLLNGHGGNMAALMTIVDQLSSEIDIALATLTYWVTAAEAFGRILQGQANLLHACEAETSMLMYLRPDLVDGAAAMRVEAPSTGFLQAGGMHRWRPIGHWSCSGVVGVPRLATADKGRLLIEAAAAAVAERLQDADLWER
jgi:creatinine amidohydrolase